MHVKIRNSNTKRSRKTGFRTHMKTIKGRNVIRRRRRRGQILGSR